MELKNDLPTYELKVPSSGNVLKVRPFIVKEEKLLHMAVAANDENDIINTTKQIVNNCILSGDFDIDKSPFFDVDYLFIALRAKSIGETIPVDFTCNPCGSLFSIDIDVANVEVKFSNIDKDIKLSNTLMFKMKYPNYSTMKLILDNDNIINKKINIIAGSVEYLKDKEKFYTQKDLKKGELQEFIETLTQEQFKKLENYIDNFPTFVIKAEANCEKCGYEHKIEYTEFISFFV
jgi:T4 bacteriophage base plate protein